MEQDVRWLRTKLEETKDESERKYILKQLELLEVSHEVYKEQKLLSE